MAGDAKKLQPIIIKRVKKGGHGAHGGAWKIAYADFVTAMMAFFLLLWLLNVTTDIQKRGIADYFQPTVASKSTSGAGGVLGGIALGPPGAQQSTTVPPSLSLSQPMLRDLSGSDDDNQDAGPANSPSDTARGNSEPVKKLSEAEQRYFLCIKAGILAYMQGYAPSVAVEFARKSLNTDVRPTFYEVEEAVDALPAAT